MPRLRPLSSAHPLAPRGAPPCLAAMCSIRPRAVVPENPLQNGQQSAGGGGTAAACSAAASAAASPGAGGAPGSAGARGSGPAAASPSGPGCRASPMRTPHHGLRRRRSRGGNACRSRCTRPARQPLLHGPLGGSRQPQVGRSSASSPATHPQHAPGPSQASWASSCRTRWRQQGVRRRLRDRGTIKHRQVPLQQGARTAAMATSAGLAPNVPTGRTEGCGALGTLRDPWTGSGRRRSSRRRGRTGVQPSRLRRPRAACCGPA